MKLDDVDIVSIAYSFVHKRTFFEFSIAGDITSSLEELKDKKLKLEIKKDTHRSLNANGYLWSLLGELQEKLNIPKEELYRQYIYSSGSYDVYCMKKEALDTFIKAWASQGLGWIVDTTESKIKGCINVLAYRGTSDYTKEEMATLLSQVVDDCIEQGIPTKRQEDIDSLLEDWKNG